MNRPLAPEQSWRAALLEVAAWPARRWLAASVATAAAALAMGIPTGTTSSVVRAS